MDPTRVVIIGGGLAGMVIAHELAKKRVSTVLLEADQRLGGKAGARPSSQDSNIFEEHGYHIIPAWYVNFRNLLRELDVDQHLIDFDRVHYLRRRGFPRFNTLLEPNYPRNFIHNVFRFGLVHWSVQFLSLYASLDLASQHFKKRAVLDRISVTGFLRSRWYRTEDVAALQNQHILQASSIASYQIGAMTARRVLASYYKCGSPFHSVLDSDLQTTVIGPLSRKLQNSGVDIRLQQTVKRLKIDQDCVVGLVLQQGKVFEGKDKDIYVIATPPDVAYSCVDGEVIAAEDRNTNDDADEKRLSDLVHLEQTPMASILLYLKRKVTNIPREHVVLYKSRYQLSFVDISQTWKSQNGSPTFDRTVLSGIASAYAPLKTLREEEAKKVLLKELEEYLQIEQVDIERFEIQTNVTRQMFLNTIGSWSYRPSTKTRLRNLYIAGDYCRSQADLTTMEGCVQAAINTASHVLYVLGCNSERRDLRATPIPTPCRRCMRVMYWLASPIAALVWVIALLRGRETNEPRDISQVRDRRASWRAHHKQL
jgi:zeta-carotene desaturase